MVKRLSRRELLRLTGAAAGASLLAACVPAATPPPATPTESPTALPATATPDPAAGMAWPVTAAEMQAKSAWIRERFFAADPPFSFICGGQLAKGLLAAWPKQTAAEALDPRRTRHTLTWTDPQTGLEVRCVAVEYADYPVVEWTVYFKNLGSADTPILEQIQGLDTLLARAADGPFVLHGCLGDSNSAKSYEPFARALQPAEPVTFAPAAGRPSSGVFPYHNLQGAGGGWIIAVGWPGQWRAGYASDAASDLRVTAGQDVTRLYLKPGEEIRTPLIALLFWRGEDVPRAQNLWRRWFLAHNLPRYGGRPPAPLAQMQVPNAEAGLWEAVKAYNQAGIKIDICWRDAGWYPCNGDWFNTGTWEVDPQAFPHGFRPFADALHAEGKKLIVWFEPERVTAGTWLCEQHPEWLISPEGMPNSLLDLGNPAARAWLTDHIDRLLTEQGIDYYRQDFNMDPLYHWHTRDAEDRQGLTENLHIQGYLAFWDELRRRHPAMLIDSCASGGRRNDLETLRRAVPLLRSDFQFGAATTLGNQGHTYGISSWIPYYGSATYALGKYNARSFYMPCFGVGIAVKPADARPYYDECRQVAPLMLGDFYPLTPYNLDPAQWIAWQFDQPEAGAGMIQAFRREQSAQASQTFPLRGLDPAAQYTVTNFDLAAPATISGHVLLTQGLALAIKESPGSALLTYKKIA